MRQQKINGKLTSSLETRAKAYLSQQGIPTTAQQTVGRWSWDIALIGSNILVDVDGTFWHSKPRAKARDKAKTLSAQREGYLPFRIKEVDMNSDMQIAFARVVGAWRAQQPGEPDAGQTSERALTL